jgi:hypothetical protein
MNWEDKTLEEQSQELEHKYNQICEAALVKVYVKTQDLVDAEDGVVPLKNFDFKNNEHKFILAVARALGGIRGTQVAVDTNFVQLWWENRKIKVKNSRLLKYKKEYDEHAADPEEILTELRPWAEELCGTGFTFDDIYYEFYA